MWDQGVEVFDEFADETFKMHAMLFCTINMTFSYMVTYQGIVLSDVS